VGCKSDADKPLPSILVGLMFVDDHPLSHPSLQADRDACPHVSVGAVGSPAGQVQEPIGIREVRDGADGELIERNTDRPIPVSNHRWSSDGSVASLPRDANGGASRN
jgi:hypothetical protein